MRLANPSFSSICCHENRADSQIKITTNNSAYVGVCKRNPSKLTGCSACLRSPILSSVGCPKNNTVIANDGSNVGIDEVHPEKVYPGKWFTHSTILPYPRVTTIGCSEDHAVWILIAHGSSRVGISKRNTVQIIEGDSWLAIPLRASIGCLKKDASVADNRPGVRIGEGHGVESVGALWKRVIGLFNPVVSTVCCSENDAGPAQLEAANR